MMYRILIIFFCIIRFIAINAQVPSSQVTNFILSSKKAWKIEFSISVPSIADSAIVLHSKQPIPSVLNFTDKVWKIGSYPVSNIKVIKKVRNGTQSITVKGLEARTNQYFAFITFNNRGGVVNYRKSDPYIINAPTSGREIGNYYKTLDTNKAVFLSQFSALLKNHTLAPYIDYRNIVPEIYEQDTLIGDSSRKYVQCRYSNFIAVYTEPFSFAKTNFNREHTLPKNWMNFKFVTNDSLEETLEGADYHNLTLTEATVNSARSDYAMDIVTSNVVNYGTAKLNNSSTFSQRRFEPQNSFKGNAARCIFYTMLTYNGIANKTWGLRRDLKSDAQYQSQSVLKTWSKNDTPDNYEIARNEWIYSVQGSRNPFIDFPDLMDCINFDDITQLSSCQGFKTTDTIPRVGLRSTKKTEWDVWYYPYSSDKYILKFYNDQLEPIEIKIFSLSGQILKKIEIKGNIGENSMWLPMETISTGKYILYMESSTRVKSMLLLRE